MTTPDGGLAPAERAALEDLKIATLAYGVRPVSGAIETLSSEIVLTTHEYPTTGGLACRVGEVYLNAPFDEWYSPDSPVALTVEDGAARLQFQGNSYLIDEIYPVPDFAAAEDPGVRAVADVAFSHLDRVRLSPIRGCAYDCTFCDLPGRISLHSPERLVAAGEVALRDRRLPIRHMLISGGSPGPRQWQEFAQTVLHLVRAFSDRMEVDVMMSSGPETPAFVTELIEAGVHGLALNMELYSDEASSLVLRAKHRRARPFLAETIAAGVSGLGSTGRVRSLIIPGLEPAEETLAGIELIAGLGADPVISPFRPSVGTPLSRHATCEPTELRTVLDCARHIVAVAGVALGPRCLPCQHNTLAFPWDVPGAA